VRASRIEFDPATAGTAHRLLGESTQRVAITFFPPATGNVTLSNDPAPTANNGWVLQLPAAPINLTLMQDGDCVQREWYAVYSGAFAPVGFIQTLS
jgi:hypothetical protein